MGRKSVVQLLSCLSLPPPSSIHSKAAERLSWRNCALPGVNSDVDTVKANAGNARFFASPMPAPPPSPRPAGAGPLLRFSAAHRPYQEPLSRQCCNRSLTSGLASPRAVGRVVLRPLSPCPRLPRHHRETGLLRSAARPPSPAAPVRLHPCRRRRRRRRRHGSPCLQALLDTTAAPPMAHTDGDHRGPVVSGACCPAS